VEQTPLQPLVLSFNIASEEEGRIPKIRLKVNTDGPVEVEIVKSEKKMSIMSMLNDDHGGLDALVNAALSEKPDTNGKSLLAQPNPKTTQPKQAVPIAASIGSSTLPGSLTAEISKLVPVPTLSNVSASATQVKVIHLAPSQSSTQQSDKKGIQSAVEVKMDPQEAEKITSSLEPRSDGDELKMKAQAETLATDEASIDVGEATDTRESEMQELQLESTNEHSIAEPEIGEIARPVEPVTESVQMDSVTMEVSESMRIDEGGDNQDFEVPMDVENSMVASIAADSVPNSEMHVDSEMQVEDEESAMAVDNDKE
jgi:hypothetical protein